MLPLEKCRKSLPKGTCPSDEELESLREVLYAVAETVVDEIISRNTSAPRNNEDMDTSKDKDPTRECGEKRTTFMTDGDRATSRTREPEETGHAEK